MTLDHGRPSQRLFCDEPTFLPSNVNPCEFLFRSRSWSTIVRPLGQVRFQQVFEAGAFPISGIAREEAQFLPGRRMTATHVQMASA